VKGPRIPASLQEGLTEKEASHARDYALTADDLLLWAMDPRVAERIGVKFAVHCPISLA
jgi:hypothetical protein